MKNTLLFFAIKLKVLKTILLNAVEDMLGQALKKMQRAMYIC